MTEAKKASAPAKGLPKTIGGLEVLLDREAEAGEVYICKRKSVVARNGDKKDCMKVQPVAGRFVTKDEDGKAQLGDYWAKRGWSLV